MYIMQYSDLDQAATTLSGTTAPDDRIITATALIASPDAALLKLVPNEESGTYTSATEKPGARSVRYNFNIAGSFAVINEVVIDVIEKINKCCDGFVAFVLANNGQCYVEGIRVLDAATPSFRQTLMPARSAESDGINLSTLDGDEPMLSFALGGMDRSMALLFQPATGTAEEALDTLAGL